MSILFLVLTFGGAISRWSSCYEIEENCPSWLSLKWISFGNTTAVSWVFINSLWGTFKICYKQNISGTHLPRSPKWTYADSWKESQRLGTAFFALFMCFLVWLSNNYVRGVAFLLATSSLTNQYNLGKTFTRTSFLSASRSCTSFWNGDVPCRGSLLIAALCIALFAFSIACVMLWTHGLEWQVQSPLAGFVVLWEQQGTQDIPSFLT